MESADALMEEKKLMSEAKYRNYMSNIDKALRNFEYSSEWADLISALGKLSKAISSNTQYQVIPRRIKISKRLAQCMHPALPGGVHLKALETYAVIFSKTRPERLATELFIYSAGLFPLLGYAAMNVRPALLNIYETHFVPLGERLRPALSGFLSGVLPGYECGLDHFERTNSLLVKVCAAVNPLHFYTVLWECVSTNASIRLPAITYLIEHFNKRLGMEEQTYIMGQNREIMMSGLCACLNDSVILVQRNALEFILLGFPMHTIYLTEQDLIKLVTNGLNTILRRDMSLNRRLYSWLLGTEVSKLSPTTAYDAVSVDGATTAEGETQASYFERHSKHILVQSLICTLKLSLECQPVDLKPYRIMVSLLDKADIGSVVLDYVLCDIIRTMTLSSGNVEVVKSANLLFATFDPAYIWSFMTSMYEKCCDKSHQSVLVNKNSRLSINGLSDGNGKYKCEVGSGEPDLVEICYLTEYLLETISLEMYNETTRVYLPKVFLAITRLLTMHLEHISPAEVSASLKLCMKIVSRVQPMITSPIKLIPRTSHGYSSSDEKYASKTTSHTFDLKSDLLAHVGVTSTNLLEKSKSDSKLNASSLLEETAEEPIIPRSYSNQLMERKSPKRKKSKSYSKLSELDKEICPDTGEIIEPQHSSSDLDTPLSIKKLKSKAKTNIRLRSSPKKTRPKDIALPLLHAHNTEPKSLDPALLKPSDETDEQPKSAPPEEQRLQKEHIESFVFEYLESSPNVEDEFTILEKCIRQYEMFFELYLARQILQIKCPNKSLNSTDKCRIEVQGIDKAEKDALKMEDIFGDEQIYEDLSTERLREIEKLFDTLRIKAVNRSQRLHCLLSRSLISEAAGGGGGAYSTFESASDFSDCEFRDCSSNVDESVFADERMEQRIQTLIKLHLNASQLGAIKLAANLLVEMSTFPNCNKNIVLDKMEREIPSWLKVLCIVASYTQGDKELQLSAISTLFDLISLLKSQIEHTTSPGVTFVVMLPLLKFGHVSFIEHKTRIFQLLTSTLWNYLGEPNIDPTQITALLYQLHNCLESGLVETVIGNRMFSQGLHSQFSAADALASRATTTNSSRKGLASQPGIALNEYRYDRAADVQLICVSPSDHKSIEQLKESEWKSCKKFELLWHLGREKQPSKGFEKTLLKVLDTLELPYYMSVRTFVTNWLRAALLRGDLTRLTKPLYKILLSPKSKRISIVYLHVLSQDSKDGRSANAAGNDDVNHNADGILERDVYAISSEFGNIRYHHMSTTGKQKRSPIRNFQKKIFGVTLSSKNKTSNFLSDRSPVPTPPQVTTEPCQDATIGLIINPLENTPHFDDESLETNESKPNDLKATSSEQNNASHEDEEKEGMKEVKEARRSENFQQDFTDESDSSLFDSESENRETSVDKDDSLTISSSGTIGAPTTTGNLKRFAGDCESVTEMLSQHERTKNRKTYRLTREKTPGESSNNSNVEEQSLLSAEAENESAHPADEYFSDNSRLRSSIGKNASEGSIASNVTQEAVKVASPSKKKTRHQRSQMHKKQRSAKKSTSSSDRKRLSCISKTSTDSNNSYGAESATEQQSLQEELSINSEQSEAEEQTDSISTTATATTTTTTVPTINVEDKRRNLSLETGSSKPDWDLTPETIEKSKQNLQILRQNAGQQDSGSKRSSTKSTDSQSKLQIDKMLFYHNHMLVYYGVYDTKQTLYAFQTLRNMIASEPRTFLCLSITTSLSSGSLKQLLIRHRKSISGKGFAGNIGNSDFAHSYRGCMQLEVLVTMCLYYARGYFSRQCHESPKKETPTHDDVEGNCRVQLQSVELLTLICVELIEIVKSMGSGLACYIADVMARCKLQKVILHCLNSSVCFMGQPNNHATHADSTAAVAEDILNFNNPQDDQLHAESFQIQLLRLLRAVIRLEHEVEGLKTEGVNVATNAAGGGTGNSTSTNEVGTSGNVSPTRIASMANEGSVKYLPNCLISQQPMFLAAVLSALQADHLRHLHRNWTDLVTSSLSCFSFSSLTNIVISVVHQLCNNIDKIAKLPLKDQCGHPPDYVVSQLEAITVLCHYCLLDNTQQTTLSHLFNQAYPQTSVASQSSNTSQLLNNIVHSFLSTQTEQQTTRNPQLTACRNAVLCSALARIVASCGAVWDSELGQLRQVKQQMMEFLSPVSLHHGVNFLAAVAVTWQERGQRASTSNDEKMSSQSIVEQYKHNSTLQATPEQRKFLSLVTNIRVMPMDSFVQTLHQVVKSPPPIHRLPKHLSVEVSALELFYFYMKSAPATQLGDSWSSLLLLLRDGLSLSPPAQFVLLMLLHEFMQRCPDVPFQDKKDLRDLHDVTSRLVDSLSNIAGSCLEQTTWLRRNLAVKEDIPHTANSRDNNLLAGYSGHQQYSVRAQSVLAAVLANLLDVAYGSQEKDKVVSIVTTLLYNITPYLKNHTTRNIPSFYACSSLLASLSGYQYTRKAWRKDMFELLLDPAFFQMDISCLPFWKQIMDSLMTYDNTTFRELMSRVSLTQTGTLNIFTSREQEYEQRAMLLKRLAFVIFCSEFDQYNKYMPEIQEQLANSLRLLSMVPSVQAAVFLCFRVLLLRMSPDHVTSLWPIIIAEMVQVFLAMEQELKCDSEDLSQQMRLLSGMETSWSSGNGLGSQTHLTHWRAVQLEASKLLEMGCVLPATNLPHFQMYRWAFVGTEFDAPEETALPNGISDDRTATACLNATSYVPHIRRIARLMDMKYPVHSPLQSSTRRGEHLMLACQQINTLQDLYGFFSTLSMACPNPRSNVDIDKEVASCLAEIENILAKDFLERMSTSTTPR